MVNMNRRVKITLSFVSLYLFSISVTAQSNGGLFMLQDNFYAQLQNPSFMQDDESLIIAVPGFSGFSFRNEANFKFSDFMLTRSTGKIAWDLEHFRDNGNEINAISQWLSIPLFYMSFPVKEGRVNVFFKDKIQDVADFPGDAVAFFENGNISETYRNYSTGEMDFSLLATHQLGVGYTKKVNKKITFGIRGKLLFGAAYLEAKNWNYEIQTSESGDEVFLSSTGTGIMAVKFPLEVVSQDKINKIKMEGFLKNYLGNISSPGLGIDAGFTSELKNNNTLTVSLTDFGFVFFRKHGKDIYLDGLYLFRGMDITDVIDSRESAEYQKPSDLMMSTKDSIRNVYRPFYSHTSFYKGISPQLYIQYRHDYSDWFSVAIANHTVFQKGCWINSVSLNALQRYNRFSFVGNFSVFNFRSAGLGAGIQWTNKYSQLFFVTDNLLAIYHPANQKTFSLTVGMNLLLNQDPEEYDKKHPRGIGRIFLFRPFYRKYK